MHLTYVHQFDIYSRLYLRLINDIDYINNLAHPEKIGNSALT